MKNGISIDTKPKWKEAGQPSPSPSSSSPTSSTFSPTSSPAVPAFLDISKLETVLSDAHYHGQVNHEMYSDEHYYSLMSPWRAAIRRRLVKNLPRESALLGKIQECLRSPSLDIYFTYTSSLGTHTFFMTALPALYFFGYDETAYTLIFILGLGVYFSSLVKDLVCSPRPLSPPVSRMSLGTHHMEYGFPSTHSTNSVSIALYLFSNIRDSYNLPDSPISTTSYVASCIFLVVYVFSIVFGRMYTGMHSISDVSMGALIGALLWAVHHWFGDDITAWVIQPGWTSPITVIAIGLLIVNQHPQPVEDCPCFEDAIAFVSAIMGTLLGRWHMQNNGYTAEFFTTRMPGSGASDLWSVGIWGTFALLKLVVGIAIIFIWRIFAKSVLLTILPPTFRMVAHVFTLPSRRFYTPATDYQSVPSEEGLHPIPSVIDLPGQINVEACASGTSLVGNNKYRLLRPRNVHESREDVGREKGRSTNGSGSQEGSDSTTTEGATVKHYDAVVLTKVVVYAGIGALAAEGVPVLFQTIGWGVHP